MAIALNTITARCFADTARVAQIEKLPSAQQDAIAARFLSELQDTQELSQPRLPGLLSGKLGDAFFEPLPEEEPQQWE